MSEHFQVTKDNWANVQDWPAWIRKSWDAKEGEMHGISLNDENKLVLTMPYGESVINWEDYLLRDEEGNVFIYSSSVFNVMHENSV